MGSCTAWGSNFQLSPAGEVSQAKPQLSGAPEDQPPEGALLLSPEITPSLLNTPRSLMTPALEAVAPKTPPPMRLAVPLLSPPNCPHFLLQPQPLSPRTAYPIYHTMQPKGEDGLPLWLSCLEPHVLEKVSQPLEACVLKPK